VQLRTDTLRARPPGSVRTDVPPSFFFQKLHGNTCDSPPRKATPRAFPYATPPPAHTRGTDAEPGAYEKNQTPHGEGRRSSRTAASFSAGARKSNIFLTLSSENPSPHTNEDWLASCEAEEKKEGTQHQCSSVRTHCALGHPGLSVRTFPLPFAQSQTATRVPLHQEKPTLEPSIRNPSPHTHAGRTWNRVPTRKTRLHTEKVGDPRGQQPFSAEVKNEQQLFDLLQTLSSHERGLAGELRG
jgi:hypothetical protein